MHVEERRRLEDYVNGLLAGSGVAEQGRVAESQMRFDGALSHAIEIIEVYLPHAASALAGAAMKTIGDLVVDYVKTKMRAKSGPKRTLVIYGPDGKPLREVEVEDEISKP